MKKNRILHILMSLGISFSMIVPTNVLAQEGIESDEIIDTENIFTDIEEIEEKEDNTYSCGDSANYTLEDGTLTISGSGEVDDVSGWSDCKDQILYIVVEEGITHLPAKAFKDCTNLISVKLPESLVYVGPMCFEGCAQEVDFDLTGIDTSNWAKDWKNSLEDEEEEMDIDNEGSESRYRIQIDGEDCVIPGEEKTYKASLYEIVDGISTKVEGATFTFEIASNYVTSTKKGNDSITTNVSSDALKNNVVGYHIRCMVKYGNYSDEEWKYVFIEKEYFTLDVVGMDLNAQGQYLLNKGRSCEFAIQVIRHYASGSTIATETVTSPNEINFEAENIEIYDSSKKKVFLLNPGQTYTMKHVAASTDIIHFNTWVPTETTPAQCTKDITITTTSHNEFVGYSLSLSGNIAVNYYLSLSEDVSSDPDAYMLFNMPNGTATKAYVKDAKTVEVGGETCFVFTHAISAKNMTSMISSQLVAGNGDVLEENTYSVEQYVDYILAHPLNYTAKQVNIAKAMLTYGNYAQLYFGYNTHNLPKVVNPLSDVDFSSYSYQVLDQNPDLEFVGARLVLTSKPGLKLYFNQNADFIVSESSAQIEQEGKFTVITFSNIDHMETVFTVMADNFNLKYSMFSFADQVTKNSNDNNLKNLMKAMYGYNALFS